MVASGTQLVEGMGEIDIAGYQQDGGGGPVIHCEEEIVGHDRTIGSIFTAAGDVHEADTCPLATLANLLGKQSEIAIGREDCREANGPRMSACDCQVQAWMTLFYALLDVLVTENRYYN